MQTKHLRLPNLGRIMLLGATFLIILFASQPRVVASDLNPWMINTAVQRTDRVPGSNRFWFYDFRTTLNGAPATPKVIYRLSGRGILAGFSNGFFLANDVSSLPGTVLYTEVWSGSRKVAVKSQLLP